MFESSNAMLFFSESLNLWNRCFSSAETADIYPGTSDLEELIYSRVTQYHARTFYVNAKPYCCILSITVARRVDDTRVWGEIAYILLSFSNQNPLDASSRVNWLRGVIVKRWKGQWKKCCCLQGTNTFCYLIKANYQRFRLWIWRLCSQNQKPDSECFFCERH